MGRYDRVFQESISDPNGFWGKAAENISWYKKWEKVLDDSKNPFYRWFSGGELNTCYNALDRHVENGRAELTALIYDSPVTNTIQKFTYRELLDQVSLFAGALRNLGVGKGDTVVIYMPMIPQATKPVPGFNVNILDSNGNELGTKQEGLLAIKLPLPPGTLPTLWQADERFLESYLKIFPGYYFTSDGGYIDEDGYVYVMGRVDDVINVAGHRLSTGEMEEVIATHKDVAECAVIGVHDSLKGQLPLGLVVLKAGVSRNGDKLKKDLSQLVRETIGPIACYKETVVVSRLPKTRSGKILRGTMRKIADGEPYSMPSTIDDPAILSEIEEVLKKVGYAQKKS